MPSSPSATRLHRPSSGLPQPNQSSPSSNVYLRVSAGRHASLRHIKEVCNDYIDFPRRWTGLRRATRCPPRQIRQEKLRKSLWRHKPDPTGRIAAAPARPRSPTPGHRGKTPHSRLSLLQNPLRRAFFCLGEADFFGGQAHPPWYRGLAENTTWCPRRSAAMSLSEKLSRFSCALQQELFPVLEKDLGPLSERYALFVTVVEMVRPEAHLPCVRGLVGRPARDRAALACAFIAKGRVQHCDDARSDRAS